MSALPRKKKFKEQLPLKVIETVSLLDSQEEATILVETLYDKTTPVVLSFINAHAYNLCCIDASFTEALLQSDIIFRDGIGMQILYNAIGRNPGTNLNGTDYIPVLINRFKGKKIALLGTEATYLKKAADKLALQGHNIALTETGFYSPMHYLELVRQTNPDVIILGMGIPKQEKLSVLLKENIQNSCLIINGGAIIDFLGHRTRRAPKWLRQLNLEWFFRLLQEPVRLYSRYVIGNYVFLRRTKHLKKHFMP